MADRNLAGIFASALLLPLISLASAAHAAEPTPAQRNWPQWRGPANMGVSTTADPPTSWSETSNVKWKTKIPGAGSATPVVWENRVFIQTAIRTGRKADAPAASATATPGGRPGLSTGKPVEVYQFVLICLDRQTGQPLWQKVATEVVPHEGHHPSQGNFAANSPVTDGQHVYAFFGSRGLFCYDMDGNLQWKEDFGDMRILMGFGEGTSPALAGDLIIVNWDHEGESFIAALDKNTGKPRWRSPRDERTSWATPIVVEHDGKAQVITAATKMIRAYDLESGKLLWQCGGLTRNVIPTPVVGNGILYATSGYQGNALLAIRLGRSGELTGTDAIAWSYKKNTPYVPSPLLYDGRIYLFATNNATLTCLDAATGRVLIDARKLDALEGVYASPVAAAGRIYLVGRNGACVVLKPSDEIEVISTNRLDEKFDASPALAGNQMFLRGREYVYCLEGK